MTDWIRFEKTPSLELIELIKMRNRDAFQAFYFRFAQQVTNKCEIICDNWHLGLEKADEASDKTFQRFWKYPNYDPTKSQSKNIDKGIILYLLGIARRIIADLWREKNDNYNNPYNGSEEIVWEIPNDNDDCGDINDIRTHHGVVVKVLSTFSEKHKVIFYTYAKYEEAGFKLPRKLLEELRTNLNLSQQTIRSYKNEVINKIKEFKKIYDIK